VQRVRDGETVTLFHMTGKIGIGLPLFGRRRPLLWAIFTAVPPLLSRNSQAAR